MKGINRKIFRIPFGLLLISVHCYSQDLDSLQKKFAGKVCNCIGNVNNYEELKPLIDKCYDTTMNYIFNGATPEEVKFYTQPGNLTLVAKKLGYYLKSTCPSVVRVINEYVKPKSNTNSYPINFDENVYADAIKDLNSWSHRIIAFDAEIVLVDKSVPNRPFLKVKIGNDRFTWVGDMPGSDFEKVGNKVRFLGYCRLSDKSSKEEFNEFDFFVFSFASLDINSGKVAFYPNSERDVYVWANGKVPEYEK